MRDWKASVLGNAIGRKTLVGLAAVAMIGMCSWTAYGDDTGNAPVNGNNGNMVVPPADQPVEPLPETPETSANPNPTAAPAAPTTYGPLMHGLELIGIGKPMENLGFNLHGYVEAGYFYDFTVPKNLTPPRTNPGDLILFPGDYKNEFMLNQLDFTAERDMINLPKGQWDVGGLIEVGYGRDFFYTHSNGILDQHNKQGGTGNDDQLDIPQAYVQLGIPIGTGLTVEAGKFVGLLGYEKIDPTQNMLYTHSYGFSYGRPYTITGVLGAYTFSDPTTSNVATLTGGISRGWNQSIYDNNGSIDGVVQIKDTLGSISFTATCQFGPEGVLPYGPPDYAHWWIVPEAIVAWQISDQFNFTTDLLYGDAPDLSQWFSAAFYLQYKLDPHLSFATRAEYYHDGRGVTTGVGGTDINYFELTFGATVNPFPDSPFLDTLGIRPEVRWDTADQRVFDGTERNQVTAAIDIIYRY
jgi:hypothetical protein